MSLSKKAITTFRLCVLRVSGHLKPSHGSLTQIALSLCKFVQAINSISLEVAIWQREWLESWPARRLSPGNEMRGESQWSLKLCVIVTSLCSCSLFSIHHFTCKQICLLYSTLGGCGNKVWPVETKPKGQLSADLPSVMCKNSWSGR